MADDDDHGDNRPDDMILDEKVVKMGEELASIFRKRKTLTSDAAVIYSNADKLGIPPSALQAAVRMVRVMDKDDRRAYQSGVRRVLKALEPAARDLFPEDVERVEKRTARAKEREAKAAAAAGKETKEQQERRLAADSNPRSDPKRGGAGKAKKTVKAPVATKSETEADLSTETGDEMIARISREKMAELEQKEGAALLDTTPKAQSEIAKQKLQDAGLA